MSVWFNYVSWIILTVIYETYLLVFSVFFVNLLKVLLICEGVDLIFARTRTIQYGLTSLLIIKQCGNVSGWEKGSSSAWAREAVRRGAEALFVNRVKHTLSSIIFHTLTYTPGHGVIFLANVSKYAHPENGRVRLYRLLLVRHSEKKKTLHTRRCAHRG